MTTFHIENFGCRAARADGEAVSSRLRAEGLSEAAVRQAEVVVINTCSVTAEADRQARAFVRKTHRNNPDAKIVVTGCYAQRAPEEIAAISGVSSVVGNSHKALLPNIVMNLTGSQKPSLNIVPSHNLLINPNAAFIWADDQFAHSQIENAQILPGEQTRPNLKIQEGCSNRCTFCIIPTTRGNSRSLAADKVIAQVEGFVSAGGKELVLSGINLGRWGRDLPFDTDKPQSLAQLVRTIVDATALPRLRLSSIEPMDWTPELIGLMREFATSRSNYRVARHAHLPLQSGSDAVLRRMHRRYRPWHYEEKVAALVDAVSHDLALGADVMVGFPGETDAEFRETYEFIDSLPFTYLHLFPFSARPGTRGWDLHRQFPVNAGIVRERMAALQALAAGKARRFRSASVGSSQSAVTLNTAESLAAAGRTSALTDNFLPVEIKATLQPNLLVAIDLIEIDASGSLIAAIPLQERNLAVASYQHDLLPASFLRA